MVRFIDDHFVQVAYVSISGEGVDEVERVLRSSMRTLSRSEVLEQAKNAAPKERALAIRTLAAVALEPEGDEQLFEVINAAADAADKDVRLAAIKAMARLGSRRYWPVIQRRDRAENATELRREVSALVDAYQEHGKVI